MVTRRREKWADTWRRRALSVPLVFLVGVLVVAAAPLTLFLSLFAAIGERHRFATLRAVAFFTAYLTGEMIFLVVAAAQWLASIPGSAGSRARLARWAEWLEGGWGGWLYRSGEIFFGLRIEVDGVDALRGERPVIVLMRHASMGDTVLAPVWVGKAGQRHIRYVVKAELRLDPLFDVIGSRLGSCFVDRQSQNSAAEVDAVCALLEGMSARDAIVLYPEGTRFSEAKRERSIARLEGKLAPELYAIARTLRHVLPPRLGGPLGLLARNTEADVVFCTHVGYEGVASMKHLLSGRAIGRRIQVSFRRVGRESIPTDTDELAQWLYTEWAELDRWVGRRLENDELLVEDAVAHRAT